MASIEQRPQILVGPRWLENRICRLVYQQETDEVWTEEWRQGAWVRTTALVRHVLKAPQPKRSQLRKNGIPVEPGFLDAELVGSR